jgi:hypothetical protein
VIGEIGSAAVGEMKRTKVRVTRTVGEHVGGGGEDRGRQRGSGTMAHHRATLLRLGSGGRYGRSKHLPCARRLRLEELARPCAIRIRCSRAPHRKPPEALVDDCRGSGPSARFKAFARRADVVGPHTAQPASTRTQWRENFAPDRRPGTGAPLAARQLRFGMPNYSAGLPGSRKCWSAHRWATSSPVNGNEHPANCLTIKTDNF